jgi:hypothetical protein
MTFPRIVIPRYPFILFEHDLFGKAAPLFRITLWNEILKGVIANPDNSTGTDHL